MKITKEELLTLIRNSEHKKIQNLYFKGDLESLDKNDFIDIFTTLFKEKKAVDVFPVFRHFVYLYKAGSSFLDYIDLVDSFITESDAAIIKQLNTDIQKIKPRRLTMGYERDFSEVVFNQTGIVVELHLNVLELSTIPAYICDLAGLRVLDLRFNRIKDFPDSINRLTELEFIDLSHNELKDLPEQIRGLHWLKGLIISNNFLKILPDFICDLENLENLDLDNNKLISLSQILLKCKNLKTINIGYNPVLENKELMKIYLKTEGVDMNVKEIKLLPGL